MGGRTKKGFPIGATIILLFLVGFLIMIANATCERWDAGENEFVLLGVALTVGIFILLVVIIRALMKGGDSDE